MTTTDRMPLVMRTGATPRGRVAGGSGRRAHRSRPFAIGLSAVALTALALTGCGNQKGGGDSGTAGSVPEGWGRLTTSGVDVAYPKAGQGTGGYTEQGDAERSRYNAAAAIRTEDGVAVSLITVQLDFTQADTAEDAAIAAEAGVQLGATIKSTRKVELAGVDDARRIDFEFDSTGKRNSPPKGTRIRGVILTGLDSRDKTFAVRIDAQQGLLADADLKKIVDSVEVH